MLAVLKKDYFNICSAKKHRLKFICLNCESKLSETQRFVDSNARERLLRTR